MVQTRGVRGSNASAARAMYKRVSGGASTSGDRGGARGSGSGAGGIVTPLDYAEKHAEGFRVSQPESLAQGLENVYGGSAGIIRDEETGAIVVFDANEDGAVLIEPAGGLSESERKRIVQMVDETGDIPNIAQIEEGTETPEGTPNASGGWGDWLNFSPTVINEGDYTEGSYEEGDMGASTGAGGGGKISKGMLLVVGLGIVALVMVFGRGGK